MSKSKPPPAPGPLSTDLYGNALYNAYQPNRLGPRPINGDDHWGPTGEDYREAVAWMHLLGLDISISMDFNRIASNAYWITRRGCVPLKIPVCPPQELIAHLKRYAEENTVASAQADDMADSLSYASILNAANALDAMDVPGEDRYLIVHPSMAEELKKQKWDITDGC